MRLLSFAWRVTMGSFLAAMGAVSALAQPPSFGPESFLSRMDQNGNGTLEPSEIDDRMRGFLGRIAESDKSINLSQPVPISRLVQAMDRARQERERSGGSPWGGGDRGDRDRGSSNSGDSSRGSSAPAATTEPLVPGFATDDLPPVLGFGEDAAPPVKIVEKDTREAAERMERYDRNKDGVLDQQEIGEGRWSDSPMQYDRNRDGKLSRDELAVRYATRRLNEEKEKSAQSSSSSSSSRSSGSRSSGSSSSSSGQRSSGGVDPRMEGIVSSIMGRYDKNSNGMLDRDEWGEMRSDPSGGDKNRDGRITKEELGAWFAERMQGGGFGGGGEGDRGRGGWGGGPPGGGFSGGPWGGGPPGGGPPGGGFGGGGFGGGPWGGGPGGPPGGSPEGGGNFYAMRGGWGDRGGDREGGDRGGERGRDGDRRGDSSRNGGSNGAKGSPSGVITDTRTYRFQSNLDRINSQFKLPDWFARSDADADGQVAMNEYASEWPESKVKEFVSLDQNGDGVITAAECSKAVEGGFKGGSSSTSTSSSPPSSASAAAAPPGSPSGAPSSRAPMPASGGSPPVSSGYTESTGRTTSAPAAPASADARYVSYAQKLIEKYDANKNGYLDKDEATQVTVVKPDTDSDSNGQITAEELAASLSKK